MSETKNKTQYDSISAILKDKKDIDILKNRINNKREAHLQRAASYLSAKEARDFSFLAPQGCHVWQAPLKQAQELIEKELAAYLKLDSKMNLPEGIKIVDGIAIYTFNCKRKTDNSGRLEQEEYALIYMTDEEHRWLREAQARGFKDGYAFEGGYKPGMDASMQAEADALKAFTEEPKK